MAITASEALAKLKRLPKTADLRRSKREWVYFVQSCHGDPIVKIGRTYELGWRLVMLQTMSPVPLKLVGAVNCPRGAEYLFHKAFAADRLHGEWFAPSERLTTMIAALPKGGTLDLGEFRDLILALGVDTMTYAVALNRGTKRRNKDRIAA